MNKNLQSKITEVVSTNNIAYLLNNNNDFSVTGYKVMQNQNGIGLLPCAKLTYNGNVKLVYLVGGFKPLSFVVTRLGINELNAIIFNLIQMATDIQGNGFFRAENLELDFDKIFVDMGDYSVHLIYFPVISGNTGKISNFDSEFRVALINLFNSFPAFNAPQFQRLCSDLSNGSMSLGQIMRKLQDNINGNIHGDRFESNIGSPTGRNIPEQSMFAGQQPIGAVQPNFKQNPNFVNQQYPERQQYNVPANNGAFQPTFSAPKPNSFQPPMTIQSLGSPVQVNLLVTSSEYLIGKNPSMVNGAVTHNPAISRVHCKITYMNGRYYITDMGSANGTYLNQIRLNSNDTMELHSGDTIRLANSDFIVSF